MPGVNPQMFAAVKGGVLAFSKSLARSVAPRVRVNVVAPGWIETSFGAHLDDGTRDRVAESTPLKRWARRTTSPRPSCFSPRRPPRSSPGTRWSSGGCHVRTLQRCWEARTCKVLGGHGLQGALAATARACCDGCRVLAPPGTLQ
jgi:hypothetical protein